MRTLTILLILISFNVSAQSFYHKKMKRVSFESKQCQAMKPKVTVHQKLVSKKLYSQKRRKNKR